MERLGGAIPQPRDCDGVAASEARVASEFQSRKEKAELSVNRYWLMGGNVTMREATAAYAGMLPVGQPNASDCTKYC